MKLSVAALFATHHPQARLDRTGTESDLFAFYHGTHHVLVTELR